MNLIYFHQQLRTAKLSRPYCVLEKIKKLTFLFLMSFRRNLILSLFLERPLVDVFLIYYIFLSFLDDRCFIFFLALFEVGRLSIFSDFPIIITICPFCIESRRSKLFLIRKSFIDISSKITLLPKTKSIINIAWLIMSNSNQLNKIIFIPL